ncbi:MAG: hypothetical protein NTV02_02750 [Candidatus Zambryskibacteria bacterium]|nr:hypothetical protein [Candidatus Zambryskibacteria bacterium]
MYDLRAIRKTYFETYLANGGNTTLAKLEALNTHDVADEHRADVASRLSGSNSWDRVSEIPQPLRARKKPVAKKAKTKFFGNPYAETRLPTKDRDL